MKTPSRLFACCVLALEVAASAHDLAGDPTHPYYDESARPPGITAAQLRLFAQAGTGSARIKTRGDKPDRPSQAMPFELFSPRVKTRWDDHYLFMES